MSENPTLKSLLQQLAEQRVIDWESALRSAPRPREQSLIRSLRQIASIADLHSSRMVPARPVATTAERAPLRRWGAFELLERIGSGSCAEVYRAYDPKLAREIAVKIIAASRRKPDPVRQYVATLALREGRNMARVEHPNVITVYGVDLIEGEVGLWMDLVQGRSLAQLMHDSGPYGASEAALIGHDLCRAVAAIHAAGLLHCDIKAQNVMRETGGRIILMDLGICQSLFPGRDRNRYWQGTPLYAAPEVLRGHSPSRQSDIYSMGVLLFHLVTDRFPFEAQDIAGLKRRHSRGKPLLLLDLRPDLPQDFVLAVERATRVAPEGRHATAGELGQDLRAVLLL